MNLIREKTKLIADPKRVVLQLFYPGNKKRINNIIDRVLMLDENDVEKQLEDVIDRFDERHKNFTESLKHNFNKIENILSTNIAATTDIRKLLIGSYFTSEYSIEAAALFNPSIVPHYDQSNIEKGELKFVLSLRATGEGHISSIEFREGKLLEDSSINLYPKTKFSATSNLNQNKLYSKEFISRRIAKTANAEIELLNSLHDQFLARDIKNRKINGNDYLNITELIDSNYDCNFPQDSHLSERVLFPISKSESMGMEDARFVLFTEENGDKSYYGTYTAYNGNKIKTQLITTDNFNNFGVRTLHGEVIKDKGFALFPRKINGQYFITSRLDGENIYMMSSNNLTFWDNSKIIQLPEEAWEFVQIGNCGSPLETKDGWLLITHAVGPMRRYVISAMLLDLNDPTKVIGRLKSPLIEPNEEEREGYVPNVVYSCGSIIHNEYLVIPYAMSDSACGFTKIKLDELLNNMK